MTIQTIIAIATICQYSIGTHSHRYSIGTHSHRYSIGTTFDNRTQLSSCRKILYQCVKDNRKNNKNKSEADMLIDCDKWSNK